MHYEQLQEILESNKNNKEVLNQILEELKKLNKHLDDIKWGIKLK